MPVCKKFKQNWIPYFKSGALAMQKEPAPPGWPDTARPCEPPHLPAPPSSCSFTCLLPLFPSKRYTRGRTACLLHQCDRGAQYNSLDEVSLSLL